MQTSEHRRESPASLLAAMTHRPRASGVRAAVAALSASKHSARMPEMVPSVALGPCTIHMLYEHKLLRWQLCQCCSTVHAGDGAVSSLGALHSMHSLSADELCQEAAVAALSASKHSARIPDMVPSVALGPCTASTACQLIIQIQTAAATALSASKHSARMPEMVPSVALGPCTAHVLCQMTQDQGCWPGRLYVVSMHSGAVILLGGYPSPDIDALSVMDSCLVSIQMHPPVAVDA